MQTYTLHFEVYLFEEVPQQLSCWLQSVWPVASAASCEREREAARRAVFYENAATKPRRAALRVLHFVCDHRTMGAPCPGVLTTIFLLLVTAPCHLAFQCVSRSVSCRVHHYQTRLSISRAITGSGPSKTPLPDWEKLSTMGVSMGRVLVGPLSTVLLGFSLKMVIRRWIKVNAGLKFKAAGGWLGIYATIPLLSGLVNMLTNQLAVCMVGTGEV